MHYILDKLSSLFLLLVLAGNSLAVLAEPKSLCVFDLLGANEGLQNRSDELEHRLATQALYQ